MTTITYEKPQILEFSSDETIVHGESLPPTSCLPIPVDTNSLTELSLLLDSEGNPIFLN